MITRKAKEKESNTGEFSIGPTQLKRNIERIKSGANG